jgi:anthranilate phosphoribosyltransferase
MEEYTPDSFKALLAKLVKTPECFTPDDLRQALEHLFTPDAAHPTQIGAFLTAIHINQIERRPDTLAAAANVLRARALKAVIEDDDKDFVVDIVGTGGDGHDTFNVSTTAAVVAAGAGARVVKVSYPVLAQKPHRIDVSLGLSLSTAVRRRRRNPDQQIY